MVMSNCELMSVEQIVESRRVPLPLAETYAAAGAFLKLLRELRDGIIHHGKDAPVVLTTERGFVIGRDKPGFASLPIWKPEHAFNEHTVSLRPALAHLVVTALYTCNSFAESLARTIAFPPDIAPEHSIFIRAIHGEALIRAQDVLRGGPVWWALPETRDETMEASPVGTLQEQLVRQVRTADDWMLTCRGLFAMTAVRLVRFGSL